MTVAGLQAADALTLTLLLFCRIGACLMLMPGFSSPRIPPQIRLAIALAVTLVLAPVLLPAMTRLLPISPASLTQSVLTETILGVGIGFMGRLFFLMLQFLIAAVASMVGFTPLPGAPIEESEPAPALASLITLTMTALFFAAGQHWEVLQALLDSYAVIPAGAFVPAGAQLLQIMDVLARATSLALQLSAPFIIFAILINLLFGIVNKFAPQVPVFFVSIPFSIMGGLALFYLGTQDMGLIFMDVFASWLSGV